MKTKILLLFSAILLSMSLQAQNNSINITNLATLATVEANTTVQVTFDYEIEVDGWAYIRFKNGPDSENNITAASVQVSAGTGTETLTLVIPRKAEGKVLNIADAGGTVLPPGSNYEYQAQLFNPLSTGWVGLATVDYPGVTLTAATEYIELVNTPAVVNANDAVDVTFNYLTNRTGPFHIYVKFKDAAGDITGASVGFENFNTTSGTQTVSLPIPDKPLGNGYKIEAQFYKVSLGWTYIQVETVEGITLELPIPPANSIDLTTAPTTVAAGSDVNITFDYVTDVANAHIFVRFKDDVSAEGLTSVSQIVTAGSGTLTLPLPIPVDKDGTALPFDNRYLYQVQLFDIDAGYSNIISENITGITLEAAPANTVVINNPPSPVLTSSTTNVTVSYAKDISGDLFVVLNFLDGGGNVVDTQVDQTTGNSGDLVFSLAIPATEAEDYSYNVQLLNLAGSVLYEKTYRGITVTSSLSTNNFNENFKNLSIYPNPFTDSFTYKFDDNLSNSTLVELFTIDGKKISTIENNTESFGNSGTINTKSLSRGMYLVRITSGSLQGTKKLIKN